MKLETIVTNGQSGAARAAWDAARAFCLATDGWMPAGYLVDSNAGQTNVRRPEYATTYKARESRHATTRPLARENAKLAKGGVVLAFDAGAKPSRLTQQIQEVCDDLGLRYLIVGPRGTTSRLLVAGTIEDEAAKVVMVAGPREPEAPQAYQHVYRFLYDVFRLLAASRHGRAEG